MLKRVLVFLMVIGAGVHAAEPLPVFAAPSEEIRGVWLTVITPGPACGCPPETFLTVFNPDGTVDGITVDPTSGGGKGVWARVGNREFSQTSITLFKDAKGNLSGYAKVTGKFTLSPTLDQATGTGTSEVFDPSGKSLGVLNFTVTATKLTIQP